MAPKLIVEVIGDTSNLERSFKRASKATGQLDRNLSRAGRGGIAASVGFRGLGRSVGYASAAFLGGAGFISIAKSSLEAASNLHEQISKTNVVFGQSAGQVEAWSKTLVASFGLAEDQALETASSIGALLRPMGVLGGEAAQQSERLTQLGSDLASFYNTSVADALAAIQSGLTGQVRPLRRYGVLLSAARVQQEALNETGKKSAASLTEQEKALARINIIFHDTAKAQGDFARTSDGMANQTRILQAHVRNLEAELGGALEPALLKIVTRTNKWLENTKNQEKLQRGLTTAANLGADAFIALGYAVGGVSDAYQQLHDSFSTSGPGRTIFDALFTPKLTIKALKTIRDRIKDIRGEVVQLESLPPFKSTSAISVLLAGAKPQPEVVGRSTDPFADASARFGFHPKPGAANRQAQQRNTFFDASIARLLDRVQDIKTLRGQIKQLGVIRDLINARIAVTKDVTRRLNLGDQVAEINRRIVEDEGTIADKAAAAVEKTKEKEAKAAKAEKARDQAQTKHARERVAAINKAADAMAARINAEGLAIKRAEQARRKAAAGREQRKVFGILGLTAAGEERAPSRGNLLAQLRKAQESVAGTPQDTKALEKRLSRLRHVLNTEFSKLTRDTKLKVAEFLDALAGKDKGGPATKQQAASIRQLVAGTGLSGAALRRLEFNLAGAHLTTPVRGGRAIDIQITTNLDGREVARNSVTHVERDNRRRPTQTRGRQTNARSL